MHFLYYNPTINLKQSVKITVGFIFKNNRLVKKDPQINEAFRGMQLTFHCDRLKIIYDLNFWILLAINFQPLMSNELRNK